MQKEGARKLIQETFERPFDKRQFGIFIKELLNRIEEAPFTYRGNLIFDDFKNRVESLERIGKYTDQEGNKADILVVHLKRATSLDRARTTQRQFVAKYLKGSRGGELKDAALVAFVSPDEEDWRFSFVKMEYKIETTDKGRVRAKEEFTPAKRYSFLVGKNENSHTAQSQLLPILEDVDHNPTLKEIECRFGVEKVTKEFFEKYRELFLEIKEALDKLVKKDKDIKADFESKGVETVDFAKKLLGQIVFLYFLQKKGWFGVARNAVWGTGPKNFLRLLYDRKLADYDNFFNDMLEPLFYEALASEREADYYSKFRCKVPFLNGGLFDPINNYDWVHTDIFLPNELFSNKEKTKQGDIGTGILDVFDRYNFTVKEDEPLEKEVAVDPEMLGKVFENLLEVKDRKSKGTYYTPREIVHYMCQESLINYLATELDDVVNHDDIETLVKHGETAVDNDIQVLEKGKETPDYSFKLPASIRDHADSIDRKLAEIRVCDPAVGSGAFLVGMMTEVIRTRSVLTGLLSDSEDRSAYDLKRHAIQSSLYGVDIDLGAVEIAKLRLWLSMIVDEDDYRQIKPLPNLDYKIMQGNSLLEEYEGIKLIDERFFAKAEDKEAIKKQLQETQNKLQHHYISLHRIGKLTPSKKFELDKHLKEVKKQLDALDNQSEETGNNLSLLGKTDIQSKAEKLLKLHEDIFAAYHKRNKDKLKEQIDKLTWDLIEATITQQGKTEKLKEIKRFQQTNTRPFFLWKLNFAEIFKNNSGFDILIANPPYISHDKIENKTSLKRYYHSYEPFADIYCYFLERGVDLLRKHGILCFITSNSYLRASYGLALRHFLSESGIKKEIINIEDSQVFAAAIVNTAVLLYQKGMCDKGSKCLVVNASYNKDIPFREFIGQNAFYLTQSGFDDSAWTLVTQYLLNIKRKMLNSGKTLSALDTKIRLGLATGANEAFIIDQQTRAELVKCDRKNGEIIKPVLRGRDIFRYFYRDSNHYILLTRNEIDVKKAYPDVYDYLNKYGRPFKERGAQGKHWTNLRACAFFDDFKKEKIVWIELTDYPRFALCSNEIYLLNSAYFLLPPEGLESKYLLGILNSKLMAFYLSLLAATSGMGTLRWINVYVKEFPIPVISKSSQMGIVNLVDKIIAAKSNDISAGTSNFENQVDKLVYEFYGLTPGEIKIVEAGSQQ